LISDSDWEDFLAKQRRLESMKQLLEQTKVTSRMLEIFAPSDGDTGRPEASADETEEIAVSRAELSSVIGQSFAQLLKRPEISIERLAPVLRELSPGFFESSSAGDLLSSELRNELKSVETEIKYEGYLLQQQRAIDRLKRAEQRSIPEWFDYRSVSGLSREMQEKLVKIRPRTLAHASRIPGVTPAAVSLVNVYIEIQARRREQAAVV
jgi:tRNA uridine 5-carboxymethylaminomethyl modification enzyme